MEKLTALDRQILSELRKQTRILTPEEITEKVDRSPVTVGRRLTALYRDGKLKRWPGKGHSYLYSHPDANVKNPYTTYRRRKKIPDLPRAPREERRPITGDSMLQLLKSWSEKKWEPKVSKDAPLLPQSIARLYELAVEQSYGAVIPKEDLKFIESQVKTLMDSALSLYITVASIYETGELWDTKKFASFLLKEYVEIEDIKDYAALMKELNQ